MGTGGPPVTVRAATLAGGEKNQDRYAYGDGWAFVLDGASSFATEQPEHDGGWYAERLKNALVHELTSHPNDSTSDIVARAIDVAASAHEDPQTCPTSTIAMARWSAKEVEVYVLGDSTAALITEEGEEEFTDSRLADIAPEIREKYRSRLAEGHGFDERHREILRFLQSQQARARNRDHGYWIAGAKTSAAHRALVHRRPVATTRAILLSTDGGALPRAYGLVRSWSDVAKRDRGQLLQAAHDLEKRDSEGREYPRSKKHDDKTLVVIKMTETPTASPSASRRG